MSSKRYSEEFKAEAAKQIIDQGRSVREVASRLGISIDSRCMRGCGNSARRRCCVRLMVRWRRRTGVCRPSSSG